MKIAVIGSGISGMCSAYLLSKKHEVHLIEKENRIGGHTATVDVELEGEHQAIDTGFIVFNERTYPNFIRLLERLGVKSKVSSMSFSVSNKNKDFEYAGNNLKSLFAQKRNVFSLSFWRMLYDIIRFNATVIKDLNENKVDHKILLGEYLEFRRFGKGFKNHYLIPMGSAIWSASYEQMLQFPLPFFVQFFNNHGLLSVFDKPKWRVIEGGSRSYIPALTDAYKERIRLGVSIREVAREETRVRIEYSNGESEYFDHVVFATHSDQALRLLADPSDKETSVLSSIRYQDNSVVLHSDESLLPRRKATWSSWNYCLSSDPSILPQLTYNMNILQGLSSRHTYCVSLNSDDDIKPEKVIARFCYAHPQFDFKSIDAQQKKHTISGVNRTSYCGAYWANGFHEDGVVSAIEVARDLGVDFNDDHP